MGFRRIELKLITFVLIKDQESLYFGTHDNSNARFEPSTENILETRRYGVEEVLGCHGVMEVCFSVLGKDVRVGTTRQNPGIYGDLRRSRCLIRWPLRRVG